MREVKIRDTAIEVELRRYLHQRGLRFRIDSQISSITRARPDVCFRSARVAVFVDGCFWHGCPDHGSLPVTNREWWEAKLAATVERDRRHSDELSAAGWRVFRVWEHEDLEGAADSITKAVRERRASD